MQLGALLEAVGAAPQGAVPAVDIAGVCALAPGQPGALAWCGSADYLEQARASAAGAVLLAPGLDPAGVPGAVAVNAPQAVFAAIAARFAPDDRPPPGVHPSAVIDPSAELGADVRIGPGVVVGAAAQVGEGSSLDAGCVIGAAVRLGAQARVGARVVIAPRCQIGARVLILPGAIIGSRGFGNHHDGRMWREIPQLGSVRIGDDVEIGANTTIDCGALGDTVIGDNVRIDNQCQIAHNVHIGAQTALAAQVGIAGSTHIGAGCMVGGQAGISGHLRIADRVILNGGSVVYQSIAEAGQYGSGSPLLPAPAFRRLIVLLRRLEPRLKTLEKALRRGH